MPRCIFCLLEKERLTDEHVFPAALGGVLVLGNSVCVECNNGFSEFEQPFAQELAPLRLLLQIPDRYGAIPQAPATVKTLGKEYPAMVKSDGSVRLKPILPRSQAIRAHESSCINLRPSGKKRGSEKKCETKKLN
jgi:hypothetical protein